MRPATIAMLAAMAVIALLASCAGEDELSQSDLARMQRLIPRGSPHAAVRSRLERLGFTRGECVGEFYGDDFQR